MDKKDLERLYTKLEINLKARSESLGLPVLEKESEDIIRSKRVLVENGYWLFSFMRMKTILKHKMDVFCCIEHSIIYTRMKNFRQYFHDVKGKKVNIDDCKIFYDKCRVFICQKSEIIGRLINTYWKKITDTLRNK